MYRVLRNLLMLDGERLSYRTLDVEQIGSVYETMMGFGLEISRGRSIAVKPTKPHGAPTTINLEALLAQQPADRAKWLEQKTDQTVTGQAAAALKDAETPEDVVAALERKVGRRRRRRPSCRPGRWCSSRARSAAGPARTTRRARSPSRSSRRPCGRSSIGSGEADAGADPRPQGLRPGHGLGRVPGGSLPPARRRGWSRPGTRTTACRRSRPMKTRSSTRGGSSPSGASTAWTRTRWRWTSPSSRSGWRRWRRTTPFTFLDHALRYGDSLVGLTASRLSAFTGNLKSSEISPGVLSSNESKKL